MRASPLPELTRPSRAPGDPDSARRRAAEPSSRDGSPLPNTTRRAPPRRRTTGRTRGFGVRRVQFLCDGKSTRRCQFASHNVQPPLLHTHPLHHLLYRGSRPNCFHQNLRTKHENPSDMFYGQYPSLCFGNLWIKVRQQCFRHIIVSDSIYPLLMVFFLVIA